MSKRKPARTIEARSASKIRSQAAGSGQPTGRVDSKQAWVLALLCGPNGATIATVTRRSFPSIMAMACACSAARCFTSMAARPWQSSPVDNCSRAERNPCAFTKRKCRAAAGACSASPHWPAGMAGKLSVGPAADRGSVEARDRAGYGTTWHYSLIASRS
jgi:hypothetical protein